MHLAQITGPKREFIEYVQVLDECREMEEQRRLTDAEILQETAYVYLSKGQLLECLKWSVSGWLSHTFKRALRTITRRKATR